MVDDGLIPDNAFDQALLARVRPPEWPAQTPLDRYDLVVIGGGAAGLVSAFGAAGLGARVAVIERHRLGGDCLLTGCVPSKALLRAARAAHEARSAHRLGVFAEPRVDFPALMDRLRAERAALARHDSAERLAKAGVHVFFGAAHFTGFDTILVNGASLRFRRAVIATGAAPARPPALAGLHTSDTIWSITELPKALLVVGAGPVGVELAQAFARLGSAVTLVEAAARILPREHADAAAQLAARLESEGVTLRTGARVRALGPGIAHTDGAAVPFDVGVAATGRSPRLDGLHLEAAGVALRDGGLALTPQLRTTNRRVYAAGDVTGLSPFTHAADAMARCVLRNAFFPGGERFVAEAIPRTIWTEPALSQLGPITPAQPGLRVLHIPLAEVDRAALDGETDGFVQIHIDSRDRIISATIFGDNSGSLVAFLSHVLSQKLPLSALSKSVFPYPSMALALRSAADASTRQRVSPVIAKILRLFVRSWP